MKKIIILLFVAFLLTACAPDDKKLYYLAWWDACVTHAVAYNVDAPLTDAQINQACTDDLKLATGMSAFEHRDDGSIFPDFPKSNVPVK